MTGLSVTTYINRHTVPILKKYLDDERLSLTQISEMMDFTSLSYFSRYCTKHLGKSPSACRRSLQPRKKSIGKCVSLWTVIKKNDMIKMFVMHTCPDCEYVEKQVEGNPDFEIIDIGKHVRNLKQFLDLRDSNPAFDEAKAIGDVGIPCYVREDGSVTLYSKDVGLEPRPENMGAACSIDGRGC